MFFYWYLKKISFSIFVFLSIVLFCSLGTWQLYRLQWKLELINEKFTASRYFSLHSGDSLFTTIDVFLDLDSNYIFNSGNPYRLNLRITYFKEDGGIITSNGFTTTPLSKDSWITLPLNGSFSHPLLKYVRYYIEIFGYDSIPIFIDNLKRYI